MSTIGMLLTHVLVQKVAKQVGGLLASRRRICRRQLQALDKDKPETQREIAAIMYANW